MSAFLKLKRVFLLVKRSDICCVQKLCFALGLGLLYLAISYSVDLVDQLSSTTLHNRHFIIKHCP